MTPQDQQLIEQAQRRPMGNSWTYSTTKEFGDTLAQLIVKQCVDFVYNCEDLTLEQGYNVRKKMLKHFGGEL
jgi:hypothetical protein